MEMATYEKAERLIDRINHISKFIEFIDKYDYKLDPPTRQSNYEIRRGHDNGGEYFTLNEAEVVFLRKALEDEKYRLHGEFMRL